MTEQTARSQLGARRFWSVALVCAGAGGLVFQFWGNATRGYIHSGSLFYWWGSQWFDPRAETEHGVLVLAVAVWLSWRNLRIRNSPTTAAAGDEDAKRGAAPLAAMLAGLGLHLLGYAVQQSRLSILALLVFAWGVLALAGGRRWGRAAAFPLGFLLLAVPVNFLDALGFNLRMAVTEQAFALARRLGVGLVRNGSQLLSADGKFQYDVAAACSGVRSLVALVAMALLLGYLGFRSWWGRLVLVLASLPYVVAGNILRVLLLVLVGERFGHEAGRRLHEPSGLLVFAVVLGLLLATAAAMRRLGFAKAAEPDARSAAADEGGPEAARPGGAGNEAGSGAGWKIWRTAVVVVVAAAAVASTAGWLGRRQQVPTAGVRLSEDGAGPVELPRYLGTEWVGHAAEVTAVEREVLPPDTGYSRRNYVALRDRRQQVFVSVVLSGRDRTSIHRPELCLAGQGWTVSGRTSHRFGLAGGDGLPATLLRIEHEAVEASGNPVRVKALFAYWFVGDGALVPTHAGMQWADSLGRLRRLRADRWAYIVVQTVVADDGEPAALARMDEVVAGVWPAIRAEAEREVLSADTGVALPAKKD